MEEGRRGKNRRRKRAKGEGRRAKGEGRRAKGEGRKEGKGKWKSKARENAIKNKKSKRKKGQ